ncbi:MAG: class I SAM-dependent methyltransferase [Alphaproteobacteria bacterium]|nr:class I SAM-dependent methyltransferase [Alphaproteobacteria bacterium]
MDVKEEEILGEHVSSHWYYVSKGRALRAFVAGIAPRSILDIGAGSGIFSKLLIEHGAAEATLVDTAYENDRDVDHRGKPIRFRRHIEATEADLALMMDVIEHVDDDVGLIRSYARLMRPGSHVLITVPAFQALFSAHDLFLEHRRRYGRHQLENVVRAAGLEPVRTRFFFGLILPLAALQRLVERVAMARGAMVPKSSLKRHGAVVNRALIAAHAAELRFLGLNRWLRLTIFCLARVPAGGLR